MDIFARGGNTYLRGFGSFIVKTRTEKIVHNINEYDSHYSGIQHSCVQAVQLSRRMRQNNYGRKY